MIIKIDDKTPDTMLSSSSSGLSVKLSTTAITTAKENNIPVMNISKTAANTNDLIIKTDIITDLSNTARKEMISDTLYESELPTTIKKGMVNKFPSFTDSELKEYKVYARKCFDLYAVAPISFFITIFYVTHANFQHSFSDGGFFISGLVFGFSASIMFYVVFLTAHAYKNTDVKSMENNIKKVSFIEQQIETLFDVTALEDTIGTNTLYGYMYMSFHDSYMHVYVCM